MLHAVKKYRNCITEGRLLSPGKVSCKHSRRMEVEMELISAVDGSGRYAVQSAGSSDNTEQKGERQRGPVSFLEFLIRRNSPK